MSHGHRTTFKILTRKKEGQSHRETEVTIDWNGISREDLMVLAKNALVQDLQARIQKNMFNHFPEKVTIVAKDMVHKESVALWEYKPAPVKIPAGLERLLEGLSQDELRKLFARELMKS